MNDLKLQQIAYAQGYAEGRLEEAIPLASELPELQHKLEETLKAFKILSDGFDAVRRENKRYETTLLMIRGAVQL